MPTATRSAPALLALHGALLNLLNPFLFAFWLSFVGATAARTDQLVWALLCSQPGTRSKLMPRLPAVVPFDMRALRSVPIAMTAAIVSLLGAAATGCASNARAFSHQPPEAVAGHSVEGEAGDEAKRKGGKDGAPTTALEDLLEAHNRRRAAHCAPPLRWSAELEKVAKSWANQLRKRGCDELEHSRSKYGENLAAGSSGAFSPEQIVDMWYDERQRYDFDDASFSMRTGHFTQLVWVGSERLGCASATCDALTVWVCNYDPPGNVKGQFQRNVRSTRCKK